MHGHEQMITTLNKLLREELTAINQYMVHSEMCENWGYKRLHQDIHKRAIDEMKHAHKLIGRILFLEGTPTVSKLDAVNIGKDVKAILESDLSSENASVPSYNAAVVQAQEVRDSGTRELLEDILKDEERHLDWLEAQRDQVAQMGIQNYLARQCGK
ncbi:MAG: bacterioferritin [Deltaproteobacteria bacterium]|nr:bacterioferritin [Deltaproteobacteria bacterium]